jgi:type IV secretory pathway VirB9-like protein
VINYYRYTINAAEELQNGASDERQTMPIFGTPEPNERTRDEFC